MANIWSILRPGRLLAVPLSLVLIAAVACGGDDTPTPQPTATPVDISAITSAVQSTVEEALKSAAPSISAAEIESLVTAAVASSVPEGVTSEEIQRIVERTVEASVTPGVTAQEVESLVATAIAQALSELPTASPVSTAAVMRALEHDPKRGGVYNLGSLANPPHFDMHQATSITHIVAQPPMYDNLIRYSPWDYTTIIPDLAHSWDVSSDGLTYTFSLQDGVQFHDGAALTAEDVKATFDRIVNPPEGITSPRGDLLKAISAVNVLDPLTVEFVLSEPRSFILQAIANGYNVIVRKQTLEDNNFDLKQIPDYPGTGPFVFKELQTGEFWTLERNRNYWNGELPYVDELKVFDLQVGAIGAALIANRVDYARLIDPVSERQARTTPGLNTRVYPIAGVVAMYPNHSRPGFSDARVRRAIHMIVDRHALKKSVEDSFVSTVSGWVAAADPQWPAYWQTAKDLPGWRVRTDEDIAAAKQLMADAGFANGMTGVDLLVLNVPFFNTWGAIVQDELKKHLNIESNLRIEDGAVWVGNRDSGEFDLTISGKGAAIETMADYWVWYRTDAALNWTQGYSNPEFDSIHEQIIGESDPAKLAALVARGTAILEDEVPIFSFGSASDIDGWWDYVKGHRLDRKLGTFHVNRWDTAWLDK